MVIDAWPMNGNYLYTDMWPHVSRIFPHLEESARQCGALKRCRRVPNAEALIRMGMVYAVSDLSLKDVAAWARALEVAFISGPGLHYRLKTAESWFERLLVDVFQKGIESKPVGLPVKIVDASVITGPGSTGTDWRAHVSLDPDTGRIISCELTDAKGGESFSRYHFKKGEIVLADRGYARARGIYSVVSSGAHVLVRVSPCSMRICDDSGRTMSLMSYAHNVREGETKQWKVRIPVPPDSSRGSWHVRKAKAWVSGRIIAFRTKKGDVVWLFTDLPSMRLSAEAAKRLFRVRWQIELLFKRLKSQLDLKDLPTRKGPTARSWLLLKFLAAAVAQQMLIPIEPFPPGQSGVRQNRIRCEPVVALQDDVMDPESSSSLLRPTFAD